MGANQSKPQRLTNPVYERGSLYGQKYDEIVQDLQKSSSNEFFAYGSNEFFVDEKFPPDKYSISYCGSMDMLGISLDEVNWVRAKDLYPNAEFIINGSSKDDINQGLLGDCWFLASLAGLAERKDLFKKVVPSGQIIKSENYCGIFKFNFWKWGEWVEVVVDDFLPVYKNQPLFTYSDDEGEVWPMLLEKAFAKLHGSYFHLSGGFTVAALEALTGGLTERYVGNLGPANPLRGTKDINKDLFQKISYVLSHGGLVCTGTLLMENLSKGIFGGHAYTITGAYQIEQLNVQLIKIRNPWGNMVEWIGPWSDNSEEMKNVSWRQAQHLKTGTGEFWMDYQDFLDFYTLVEFTHTLNDWSLPTFYHGSWENKKSCKFLLTMFKDDEVFLSLEQKYTRESRDELDSDSTVAPIGVSMFHLPGERTQNLKRHEKIAIDKKNLKSSAMDQVHFGNTADWKELTSVTFHNAIKQGQYLVKAARFTKAGSNEFFLRVESRKGNHQLSVLS